MTDGARTDAGAGRRNPHVEATAAAQLFLWAEHAAYLTLGAVLVLASLLAIVSAVLALWEAALHWGASEELIRTIDRMLFVLMMLEILHTVRVSVRSGTLAAEPFLIVGLIASIRRVLVITLSSSEATHPGAWTPEIREQFMATMLELGVLALLIVAFVVAIFMLRRRRIPADEV